MSLPTQTLHATSVAIGRGAVLLLGISGSGKSDLALRLIEQDGRLVSDDQTIVTFKGGRLLASAPRTLQSQIEVRGLGIVKLPPKRVARQAPVVLLVELVAPSEVERMPQATRRKILGRSLPLLRLAPFEASAPAKLRLAMSTLSAG